MKKPEMAKRSCSIVFHSVPLFHRGILFHSDSPKFLFHLALVLFLFFLQTKFLFDFLCFSLLKLLCSFSLVFSVKKFCDFFFRFVIMISYSYCIRLRICYLSTYISSCSQVFLGSGMGNERLANVA